VADAAGRGHVAGRAAALPGRAHRAQRHLRRRRRQGGRGCGRLLPQPYPHSVAAQARLLCIVRACRRGSGGARESGHGACPDLPQPEEAGRQAARPLSRPRGTRAGELARGGAEALSPGVHRALLGYLCDEALDCEALRGALAARLDAADGVKQELRKAVAGDRGKLKVPGACRQECLLNVCAVYNPDRQSTRSSRDAACWFTSLSGALCLEISA